MSAVESPGPGGPAPDVRIDRITLHVTDMDPLDARRLAEAVALALAPTLARAPEEGALDRLAVRVHASSHAPPAQVAAQVARRLAPLLARVSPTEAAR